MILYFHADPPHAWALVDRRGSVVEDGVCNTLSEIPVLARTTQAVVVVAGELVTVHEVQMPARSRGKALVSAPYVLEERLATNVDELAFTLLEFDPGKHATIAVVEQAYIEELQKKLDEIPLSMDAVVPEYFMVPLHQQARQTLAKMPNGKYALRIGEFGGMILDENTLEYWWQSLADLDAAVAVNDFKVAQQLIEWGGTSVSEWQIGADFPDWLRHGKTAPERINVMGPTSPAHRSGASSTLLKVAVILFGIGLLARIGVDLYENYALYRQNEILEQEIVKVFHEAFPDVRRIVNPRLQMEQGLKQLRTGAIDAGAFQTMLSSLAAAIPGAGATLDEITFRDDFLLVTCTTKDFAGLDRLKAKFSENRDVRVELISSGSRDNKVSARFKLQRA